MSPIAGRRRWLLVGAIAVVVAAFVAVLLSGGGDDEAPRVDAALTVEDLRQRGERLVVAPDPGGKPLVLNFFASWCEPCKRELPLFARVSKRSASRIAFLGIAYEDSRSGAIDLLDEYGIDYPAGWDPEGSVGDKYGVRAMPTTVFISAAGTVVGTKLGEIGEKELAEWIDRLEAS